MVTFETTIRSNTNVPDQLTHHDNEGADILILLHAATDDSTARMTYVQVTQIYSSN